MRFGDGGPAEESGQEAAELTPGTVLVREWDQQSHRVMVLADGFAWNGQTYDSLSRIASAITGTRWDGPRFKARTADTRVGRLTGQTSRDCLTTSVITVNNAKGSERKQNLIKFLNSALAGCGLILTPLQRN